MLHVTNSIAQQNKMLSIQEALMKRALRLLYTGAFRSIKLDHIDD